jgi:2-keto-4-pentenoate hydratase/2-oxohepta-3-ene-1,7-dioic acid hydratase in catechol pathway
MNEITIPGTELTPKSIYCIGRNYIEHAKELNNPIPSSPLVFLNLKALFVLMVLKL